MTMLPGIRLKLYSRLRVFLFDYNSQNAMLQYNRYAILYNAAAPL
jgi:hypothetical protein